MRAEIRDSDAKHGLGMNNPGSTFNLDPGSATAKSQKIRKRYNDVLGHREDKKRMKLKDF